MLSNFGVWSASHTLLPKRVITSLTLFFSPPLISESHTAREGKGGIIFSLPAGSGGKKVLEAQPFGWVGMGNERTVKKGVGKVKIGRISCFTSCRVEATIYGHKIWLKGGRDNGKGYHRI